MRLDYALGLCAPALQWIRAPPLQERIEEWFVEYLREPGADVGQVSFLFEGFAKRIWRLSTDDEAPAVAGELEDQLQRSAAELAPLQQILLSKLRMWEDEAADDEVVLDQHLWHTPTDMAVLRQRLRPNLTKRQDDVKDALFEMATLEVVLSDPAFVRPHLLAAALPRHGRLVACELLGETATTPDKRLGLQLVKALGLGCESATVTPHCFCDALSSRAPPTPTHPPVPYPADCVGLLHR